MISRKFEQVNDLIRNTDDRWSDKKYVVGLRFKALILELFNYFLVNSLRLVPDCSYDNYREIVRKNGPVILSLWHEDFLSCVYFYRYNNNIAANTSLSKDGDILTKILDSLGYKAIRGSSSRGGARVILEAIKKLKEGVTVALAVDGPKGPVREIKPGIIKIAQKTGAPIVAMNWAYNNTIRLNSWDKTRIPLPFSKSVVHIGKPLFINPSISIDEGCKILKSYMFECENLAVQKLKAGC